MVAQPERGDSSIGAAIASDAFERAQPVVERMREHVDMRGIRVDELAIELDLVCLPHRDAVVVAHIVVVLLSGTEIKGALDDAPRYRSPAECKSRSSRRASSQSGL